MRTSTIVLIAGVLLFALPIPGTFILGVLVAATGVALRVFVE
ncbi:hypothetical protein [Halobellus clavatus]|jgi:hypothetical protein|uniref:Uncharacterized protein n=1 Tax=Halobellus clavatus TaxID=660517 RepID=A0A1H3HWU8_9EURY|nr:hypothetical protein [Halobellus clavatus]SDY19199.1 hypothetical protein SAMN04487946_10870 [Halobellus clavatus]